MKLYRVALFLMFLMFTTLIGCAQEAPEMRSFFEQNKPKEIRPMIDVATNEQVYLIVDMSKPKEGEK